VIGIDEVLHWGPSTIGIDTISKFRGKVSYTFLQGCGLSDWEIESTKLYNPDLSNHEIDEILYKLHDLRATQSIQTSPLFISYSHADNVFVDKLEGHLNKKGIRFWRDIYDMKSGRIEKQINQAIELNTNGITNTFKTLA
jgi:TIR domain